MRALHPLAKYPGPLLASLTNGWKAYYVYKLFFHERLIELHQRHGPVVRVGPNHLHFWDGNAIATIYKGGRSMGKSEFYDAFTAFNPNLFGTTNDDVSDCRVTLGTMDHAVDELLGIHTRYILFVDGNSLMDSLKLRCKTWSRWLRKKWNSFKTNYERLRKLEKHLTLKRCSHYMSLTSWDQLLSVDHLGHRKEGMKKYCLRSTITCSWLVSWENFLYNHSPRQSVAGLRFPEWDD